MIMDSSQTPQQLPVENQNEQTQSSGPAGQQTWREEIEIASDQLVARVKELIAEGNVRRLIIRGPDDKVMLEVPLTAGVAVGGILTVLAPVLAALGALAALLARAKVEIVRTNDES
jgi:hypothetical protein